MKLPNGRIERKESWEKLASSQSVGQTVLPLLVTATEFFALLLLSCHRLLCLALHDG